MTARPFVTTFYSYKGGVGRTTLAVNVAVALARRAKTLLWDLDVEAPGLQHITALKGAKPPKNGYFKPLLDWQQAGCPPTLTVRALRLWDQCLWPVQAQPNLHLLPAAAVDDEQSQLRDYAAIDWADFFARDPDKGLALIDALLAHWHGAGFEFVCIDSRTGITDLGALLTAVVPDMTLLVGNFGVQNVRGLALMWQALQPATGEHPKRVERGREPLLRELVASPIPATSDRLAAGREIWANEFGLQPTEWLQIDENDALRFSERIALLELPDDHELVSQYRAVAQRVLAAREGHFAAARAEDAALELYPELKPSRNRAAMERGREAQARGARFEERVAHLLELLRYSVERETLVDGNRIDLIASTSGTLEDVTYFVECKDTAVNKDMVDKITQWIGDPQAKARNARAMIVGRSFAPAALQTARNRGVQCFTLAQLEERLLMNFKPYLARLRAEFEQSALAKGYVSQYVRQSEPGPARPARADTSEAKPLELLPLAVEWAAGKGKPLWVLLGDYGTGKTAFTQRFAYELARRCEAEPAAPVPVLINLRDYPNATSLETVIDEHLAKTINERGRAPAVLHLLAQGRCVLLLDSFDEMGLAAVGVSVEEQFRQLARPTGDPHTAAGGRVLITCREEFFREREEAVATAAGAGDTLARAGSALQQAAQAFDAQIETLQYFNREQVREFLELRLGAREAVDALKRIDGVHGLADLATRPQLLDIVLDSLPELVKDGRPVSAGLLYFTYATRWLKRHRPAGARLSSDQVLQLLELLAQTLWARGAAPLHYSQLAEVVKSLSSVFPTHDPVHVDLHLRTAAFLTRSPDGHYRFSHRSFLEFFYARRLLRLAEAGDDAGIVEALGGAALRMEVVRFFADLWQGNAHDMASPLAARMLESEHPPMVAANLLRLGYWLGLREAEQSKEASVARRDAVTQQAWAITLPAAPARAMLQAADLSDMSLAGAPLAGALLDRALLDRAKFDSACLDGASLRDAHAEQASFAGASCDGIDATGLSAVSSRWAAGKVNDATFTGANLRNSDWRGARIEASRFERANFTLALLEAAQVEKLAGSTLAHASSWAGLSVRPAGLGACVPRWRQLSMDEVNAVAYSPDGTQLASGGGDGTLRQWDAASGKELRRLEGHGGGVTSVAYSPDGTQLASGGDDGTLRLWDAASGKELRRLEGHGDGVMSVAYSPDGTQLASGGDDGTLRLWDAASGKELRRLEGHGDWVTSVAYSPDGTQLASGGADETLRLWDAASGNELRRPEGHGCRVTSVAYSPDGSQLASGDDEGTLRLWDAASGKELRRLEMHDGGVISVAYSPDGTQLASGGADRTLRLCDAASGKELRRLEGHGGWVRSVAYSRDGTQLASGCGDGTLRLWDAGSGKELRRLGGHGRGVTSVAYSPSGTQLASGNCNGTLRVWDAASGKELRRLEGHGGWVTSVAYSPDGTQLASGDDDGTLRLWDAASGKELRVPEGRGDGVTSVAYSPDGTQIASGSGDGTLRLWDAASRKELRGIGGHGDWVTSVAYSPDGTQLASGGGNDVTLRLWDAASGNELRGLEGHGGWVSSVAYSPDGTQLASGGSDGTLRLWDVASGKELRRLEGHYGGIRSVAYSPDGTQLASGGSDGTLRLWDAASGKELRRLEGHGGGAMSATFSADGDLAVAGTLMTTYARESLIGKRGAAAPAWRFQTRIAPSGNAVTLYPDGTHAGEGDALEWLEYEELPTTPPPPGAPFDPLPTLHRATDVPWLGRMQAPMDRRRMPAGAENNASAPRRKPAATPRPSRRRTAG